MNNLLSDRQYGFRAGVSVSDQLLLTYNYVISAYDQGCAVDMIYFDYKKAFDKINHRILLDKLYEIGIRKPLLGWLESFLTGRTMQVVVHGSGSERYSVTSGVPQGTVLAPLLFLIYVNHVTESVKAEYCLFADDLKLYLSMRSDNFHSIVDILQDGINSIYHTSRSWGS